MRPTTTTTTTAPGGRKGGGKGGSGKGAPSKGAPSDPKAPLPDPDDETNAGFGKYLRSQEGIEMMKLFVIANTIVVFMTMAWPQMQQSYQILRSLVFKDDDGDDHSNDIVYLKGVGRKPTMLLLAFRSFFFIAVILGYSTGIWRLINDYFRREFQSYLAEQAQTNKYLLRDPETAPLPQQQPGHQQLLQIRTDSIKALLETDATGSGGEMTTVADPPGDEGKRDVNGVVGAAEATDIRERPVDDGGGEEETEDKWISYWRDRRKGEPAETNAYCRISPPAAEPFSGCD